MPVTIYHNPRCNTSRKTLALLRDKGIEPEIVEYLKTPYSEAQLKTLLGQMKLPAKAIVRRKEGGGGRDRRGEIVGRRADRGAREKPDRGRTPDRRVGGQSRAGAAAGEGTRYPLIPRPLRVVFVGAKRPTLPRFGDRVRPRQLGRQHLRGLRLGIASSGLYPNR